MNFNIDQQIKMLEIAITTPREDLLLIDEWNDGIISWTKAVGSDNMIMIRKTDDGFEYDTVTVEKYQQLKEVLYSIREMAEEIEDEKEEKEPTPLELFNEIYMVQVKYTTDIIEAIKQDYVSDFFPAAEDFASYTVVERSTGDVIFETASEDRLREFIDNTDGYYTEVLNDDISYRDDDDFTEEKGAFVNPHQGGPGVTSGKSLEELLRELWLNN